MSCVMSVSRCVSVYLCLYLCVDTRTETFLQSCGVADLITSCYSSKIQVMADTFIKAGSYKVRSSCSCSCSTGNGSGSAGSCSSCSGNVHVLIDCKDTSLSVIY